MRRVIRWIRPARFWAVAMVLTVPMFGCNSNPTEPECEEDPACEEENGLASLPAISAPAISADGQWIVYGPNQSGEFH